MFDNLFVEKYRPKRLCDIILSPTNERSFKEFAVKQEIPNLVFLGNPGIGKTSLAKILVNDVLGCQYLYINASDENGIDTIRNKVINFAQTKSIDGNKLTTNLSSKSRRCMAPKLDAWGYQLK